MHIKRRVSFIGLLALFSAFGLAHAQQRYFYKGRDYGSEALFNPLTVFINASYDIAQLDGYSNDIFRYDYAHNASTVFRNLSNPFGQISRFGWGNFLTKEIFPLSVSKNGANWWPNYQLHLIGGGRTYTALSEWYETQNTAYPKTLAFVTYSAYQLLNEIVENNYYEGDDVDPIADMYIFNLAGIALFSSDNVKKFFAEELHLADWSGQASIVFPGARLENFGQSFSMKWKIPFFERWYLFYYFGMSGLGGLSYRYEDGSSLSVSAGLRAKFIRKFVIAASRLEHEPDLSFTLGMFYDRENSLLLSLIMKTESHTILEANIYPGVLSLGGFSPGLWLQMHRDLSFMGGITTRWAPGIGIW